MGLSICCVNWRNYAGCGDLYVKRLVAGVAKHSGKTLYRFLAFDETDLPGGAAGWWNKIALFEPGRFPRGERVLFFDLDTVITGPLADLLDYEVDFAMLSDFYHPDEGASGVMAWTVSEETEEIWKGWEKAGKPQFHPKGDGGWISAVKPDAKRLQAEHPGLIVSFKQHCLQGVPPEASVVCFHGLPRPHALASLMDHWK